MPYYWVPVADAPFPHGMRENDSCPFALTSLRAQFPSRPCWWDPKPDVYRELYDDPDFQRRARGCSHHIGDWSTVGPAVASLLASIPTSTGIREIEDLARTWPAISALSAADRHLALALLDPIYPILFVCVRGEWLVGDGQHRICSARIAGASQVPVWFRADVEPPTGAKPAQRISSGAGRRGSRTWWKVVASR